MWGYTGDLPNVGAPRTFGTNARPWLLGRAFFKLGRMRAISLWRMIWGLSWAIYCKARKFNDNMGAPSDSILIPARFITVTDKPVKMTLTKADIGTALYKEVGLSKTESSDLIDGILGHISDALIQGRDVKITNFGKFKLSHKKERVGRNPKTGESAIIPHRKVVTFKPSPYLLRRVDLSLKNKK